MDAQILLLAMMAIAAVSNGQSFDKFCRRSPELSTHYLCQTRFKTVRVTGVTNITALTLINTLGLRRTVKSDLELFPNLTYVRLVGYRTKFGITGTDKQCDFLSRESRRHVHVLGPLQEQDYLCQPLKPMVGDKPVVVAGEKSTVKQIPAKTEDGDDDDSVGAGANSTDDPRMINIAGMKTEFGE
jgi:hypothetical protein